MTITTTQWLYIKVKNKPDACHGKSYTLKIEQGSTQQFCLGLKYLKKKKKLAALLLHHLSVLILLIMSM